MHKQRGSSSLGKNYDMKFNNVYTCNTKALISTECPKLRGQWLPLATAIVNIQTARNKFITKWHNKTVRFQNAVNKAACLKSVQSGYIWPLPAALIHGMSVLTGRKKNCYHTEGYSINYTWLHNETGSGYVFCCFHIEPITVHNSKGFLPRNINNPQ